VEQSRSKESNDEGFGDFWTRLELGGPKHQHPNGPNKELERGKKPWERENVQHFLIVNVEHNVLEVP